MGLSNEVGGIRGQGLGMEGVGKVMKREPNSALLKIQVGENEQGNLKHHAV
jgi:hypothetical protein